MTACERAYQLASSLALDEHDREVFLFPALRTERQIALDDALTAISSLFPTPEQEATVGKGNWFAGRVASYDAVKKLLETK